MLRGYARLQFDLAPRTADLLGLGLADLRPGSVPWQFKRVFPCYPGHSGPAGHAIRSLAAMLEPDPVHPRS